MQEYLAETAMLDYTSKSIQDLVQKKEWKNLDEFHQIQAIYNYVCNDILFGYKNVLHSWVEVFFEDKWYELEAFIIDKRYLRNLQTINKSCNGAFCGYGVAVTNLQNPAIDWNRNNTYVQSEGINQDFRVYNCPDDILKEHHQDISKFKGFIYRNVGRHLMNQNVKKIRNQQ